MKHGHSLLRVFICSVAIPAVAWLSAAQAEHDGKIQILLLGDSTTEGSVPRIIRPEGPHLETVLEQLLAAEGDLPPCHVINSSLSGEYIRRLFDSGRYDRDVARLPGIDFIFIRYGLNDRVRVDNFATEFPKHFHELLARLRKDHPQARLIPMTVIPFGNDQASAEINGLVRQVAENEQLEVFDIDPRYAAELAGGYNALNYRRYPLEKIPAKYHELVKPFVHGSDVLVMANELDAILGHLPNWFSDRHQNLAGYNVIADETAKYLAPLLRDQTADATIVLPEIRQRLTDGRLTRIVCFGDSITGAYYHTGGLRAWPEMLGLALQQSNPRARLEMINAGISGHTTGNALERIEQDVLAKSPDVVVVMFGMNDVTRVTQDAYENNMREIVSRCEGAEASVVLCTPNAVIDTESRPEEKLAAYAAVVRKIAAEETLPLVDLLADGQEFRRDDPVGWSLTMSDEIHPNMNGHIRFAERIAEVISGRQAALSESPPPFDALHHTFGRLQQNETVRLVAVPPYDRIIPERLSEHFPDAMFDVTVWPTETNSVADMAEWAKTIRGLKPDLVIPAVSLETLTRSGEGLVADYEWMLNWSFPFGGRAWDVVPVLPLDSGPFDTAQQELLRRARFIAVGKDIRFIDRSSDDERPVQEIVGAWIAEQKSVWAGANNHLPATNGSVLVPAQPWPRHPGPRVVRVSVHYPQGELSNVNERTGIMMTLHNWAGEGCRGTADPRVLAERLNVIAVCVDYLQSGKVAALESPEPYDFGYLQAVDALRALAFVRNGLRQSEIAYDDGRIFCTGGSGGGNVTLMTNKLAPRTFACVVDMCGMKKLSNEIAFGLPGGTHLNARWSPNPDSPDYLSTDEQAIRFVGNPDHLKVMKLLDSKSKVIVIHGRHDASCPFPDALEMVAEMDAAELDVEPHFIGEEDLDGTVFTSAGHPLGNRTEIVLQVAGKYLSPESPDALRRTGPSDFDRQEDVVYPTENGQFVISYRDGIPAARWELVP